MVDEINLYAIQTLENRNDILPSSGIHDWTPTNLVEKGSSLH